MFIYIVKFSTRTSLLEHLNLELSIDNTSDDLEVIFKKSKDIIIKKLLDKLIDDIYYE